MHFSGSLPLRRLPAGQTISLLVMAATISLDSEKRPLKNTLSVRYKTASCARLSTKDHFFPGIEPHTESAASLAASLTWSEKPAFLDMTTPHLLPAVAMDVT
jgi:hypothetical protein